MEIPVLKVLPRNTRGKGEARRMREQGTIPAVCYGKGKEPLPLTVDPEELVGILKSARGLNSLIRLNGAEDRTVFVQEIQRHPVERHLLHVDFLSVDTEKSVQRTVPVRFGGKSPGVKLGGLLQIARRRLMVESLPANLPESIEVDISTMEIGDVQHVADLKMPEGVTAVYDRNFTVCAVLAPTVEEKPAEEGEEGEEGEGVAGAVKEDGSAGDGKKDEGGSK